MKKLILLAMVFILGFALSPVFASGYVAGDGVFIGVASEHTVTANPILGVEQLGTAMEALLAVGIGLIVFRPLYLLATGPAPNVPERYDKSFRLDLRKWLTGLNSQGRFERQGS